MNIVLVEDDPLQSETTANALRRGFGDAEIECIETEHDFMTSLARWRCAPPALFIVDVMLPWLLPGDEETLPAPAGGYRLAGVRCAKAVLAEARISSVPIILHSVIYPEVIREALNPMPAGVFLLSKEESLHNLVLSIRGLIQASTLGGMRLGTDIFLVHGRDDEAKEAVARFIERLDARAIILHEQPNGGRAIIEKFEAHSDVAFAIVLLTPDDFVRNTAKSPHRRARQNVIFELGYFYAKLGRNKVCALYKEGVEIPSDIQGVIYVPMDSTGAWRMLLSRELKAAGLPLNYDKVI